jgi:hypothetical protein
VALEMVWRWCCFGGAAWKSDCVWLEMSFKFSRHFVHTNQKVTETPPRQALYPSFLAFWTARTRRLQEISKIGVNLLKFLLPVAYFLTLPTIHNYVHLPDFLEIIRKTVYLFGDLPRIARDLQRSPGRHTIFTGDRFFPATRHKVRT